MRSSRLYLQCLSRLRQDRCGRERRRLGFYTRGMTCSLAARLNQFDKLGESGTTGLPKAFAVGIERAYYTASVRRKTFGQIPGPSGDRTYHCMPLYHGTGGFAALIDLMGGMSIAIAPKFSTSRFWLDCIDSDSTISLYGGLGTTIHFSHRLIVRRSSSR